ncbi:MAG: ABC transporter ATP-binding protein [Aphanothece sp. CMT-3BRIN-NPC111]|jgi:lipopolysaccharide transport system ATP-binding protein|nr:ABC transporter ATP-binding protein [Aphanothece sp. CMT-3BRIN-NPC111]
MSKTAILVESLGKRYIIGHKKQDRYISLRDTIADTAKSLSNRVLTGFRKSISNEEIEEFWALKDVSFEINQGERVGIIGRNGSGKSTLLKILSRITEPTKGRISIKGRVASLLEVGTGFHPELTGRENIYLNGAILGMSKAEIKKKFDEIVAFSEVEKFLDTPVKRYSSGMYVRLAFAVAAHLEPEILIVDEVLAVGDAQFQKKCLGKMEEVGKQGRTVLFVSHTMAAISNLCQRVIWLNKGQLEMEGQTSDVVAKYLSNQSNVTYEWHNYEKLSLENEAKITYAKVVASGNNLGGIVSFDEDFSIEIEYEITTKLEDAVVFIRLTDALGTVVLTTWDTDKTNSRGKVRHPGKYSCVCKIPGFLLKPGYYSVTIGVNIPNVRGLDRHDNIIGFEISTLGFNLSQGRLGVITPLLDWQVGLRNS